MERALHRGGTGVSHVDVNGHVHFRASGFHAPRRSIHELDHGSDDIAEAVGQVHAVRAKPPPERVISGLTQRHELIEHCGKRLEFHTSMTRRCFQSGSDGLV